MAFFNICYFRLITVSSLSVAAVMLYTAPAFVMGLSALLFKEKITKMKIFAVILTVVGCAFVTGIVGSPVKLSLEAILLGLGAGVGYALYSIFSRYALLRGYHNFTIVLYTFIFTAAAVIPLSDMGKLASVVTKSPGMAGFSALCGIVTTVFPYIVYNFGLTAVENGKAAIAASVEPVVATLIGVFIFRETMTAGNLAGIFMVLAAIVLANRREKQNHC
jgi:drug/metabolite transporter (DMT)-like permease